MTRYFIQTGRDECVHMCASAHREVPEDLGESVVNIIKEVCPQLGLLGDSDSTSGQITL